MSRHNLYCLELVLSYSWRRYYKDITQELDFWILYSNTLEKLYGF